MSDWIQIKIRTTSKNADTIAALLEQLGSLAVTYSDAEDSPILEPLPGERRLWPNTYVTGLFEKRTYDKDIVNSLKQILGDHVPVMSVNLEDRDWIRAWMDSFKPLKFGKRLWICPTWCKVPEPDAVTVMLDPGLAFGTGTHPTTSLCLEWLDSLDLTDKTVLDYGCGSGILAIASKMYGAPTVVGVDNDASVIQVAKDNAEHNGISDITFYEGSASDIDQKFDIVAANILANVIVSIMDDLTKLCLNSSKLILSGIMTDQNERVINSLKQHNFEVSEILSEENWSAIIAQPSQK